jgi:hypothetical protein
MRRLVVLPWVVWIAVFVLFPPGPAGAQGTLPENHYKTYETLGPALTIPMTLRDQFGFFTVSDITLEKFANPVDKNGEGIFDFEAHQTWWRLFIPQAARTVVVADQFGAGEWTVGSAFYLLAPALKNPPAEGGTLPDRNHYLCYEVLGGPSPGADVVLSDQFGTITTQVGQAKLLCNPVEKTVEDVSYPVVDPVVHLACYDIVDPNPYDVPLVAMDQFGFWSLVALQSQCLCVPATKGIVGTDESTWGRIKSLYAE